MQLKADNTTLQSQLTRSRDDYDNLKIKYDELYSLFHNTGNAV